MSLNLNHIHLGVADVARSRAFYEKHFGFRKKFEHGAGVFLENNAGFLLAIDPVAEVPTLPDWFHLGFCLDRPEPVEAVFEGMNAAGVRFPKALARYGEDAVSFQCLDPDGYRIEVSWHRD